VEAPECKLIALSSRAMASIAAEAFEHNKTETGGILLGHYVEGVWFVMDVVDPGLKVTRKIAEFSYDEVYVNHLFKKVARTYKYTLKIIGLWHRHPGSMDHFSGVDDQSHKYFVDDVVKNGAISILLNFDPTLRLTAYYVDKKYDYHKPVLKIGDEYIAKELLKYATISELHEQYFGNNQSEPTNQDVSNSENVKVTFYMKSIGRIKIIESKEVKKGQILPIPEKYKNGYLFESMETGEPLTITSTVKSSLCVLIVKK
jgi:proteasome lid subunit RPN8/RPN11